MCCCALFEYANIINFKFKISFLYTFRVDNINDIILLCLVNKKNARRNAKCKWLHRDKEFCQEESKTLLCKMNVNFRILGAYQWLLILWLFFYKFDYTFLIKKKCWKHSKIYILTVLYKARQVTDRSTDFSGSFLVRHIPSTRSFDQTHISHFTKNTKKSLELRQKSFCLDLVGSLCNFVIYKANPNPIRLIFSTENSKRKFKK